MILKFSFQNEIHRSSEPPQTFSSLSTFLSNMFQASLPESYDLFYVNFEGQNILLSSDEDYEVLKGLASAKAVKVLIVAKGEKPEENPKAQEESEYEVIAEANEPEQKEDKKVVQEESKDILDKIAQDITKAYVLPDLMQINGEIPHESMIQKTVRDSLYQHLPSIMFHVRDTLTKQGLIKLPNIQPVHIPVQNQRREEKGEDIFGKVWKTLGGIPDTAVKFTDKVATKIFGETVDVGGQNEGKEDKGEFLGSMTKTLNNLSSQASSMADTLAHKLTGDPYVLTAEGRYPRSAVDKVSQLQLIFPEGDKKEMLDFVQKLPKEISIEQVASLYADFKNL